MDNSRILTIKEDITTYIAEKITEELVDSSKVLATKEDIALVKQEIADVRISAANNKFGLIKWMFIFWIGQVTVAFDSILLLLRK